MKLINHFIQCTYIIDFGFLQVGDEYKGIHEEIQVDFTYKCIWIHTYLEFIEWEWGINNKDNLIFSSLKKLSFEFHWKFLKTHWIQLHFLFSRFIDLIEWLNGWMKEWLLLDEWKEIEFSYHSPLLLFNYSIPYIFTNTIIICIQNYENRLKFSKHEARKLN